MPAPERKRSEAEIDAIHEDIRRRFPSGLNYDQFKIVTLQTADGEGRVYPPPLIGMGTFQMITKMSLFDKLLDYRGTHHTPYVSNHFISDKGREYLAAHQGSWRRGLRRHVRSGRRAGACVLMIYIVPGDCLQKMAMLPAASLDAVVTDPPYGLAFMGKDWDHGVPGAPFWQQMLRLLKPGAHLVAFGGSRTYHRLTCAIEDAGFEIRDSLLDLLNPDDPIAKFMDSLNDAQRDAFVRCIDHAAPGGPLAWLYGTGFPKSHDVSKGIDKALGAEREIVGEYEAPGYAKANVEHGAQNRTHTNFAKRSDIPATPQAAEWEGWGTALKPAFEPIVLARKPMSEGTVAANVLRWGTGALNIGGCRVPGWKPQVTQGVNSNPTSFNVAKERQLSGDSNEGRWPANVVHDGSDEVVGAFPSTAPAKAGGRSTGRNFGPGGDVTIKDRARTGHDDNGGSAARFFYSAKASRADRAGSKHPTVKPIALMQWLCRLVTPPGGTVLDPFAGSGTTGAAAAAEGFNAILMEKEPQYVEDMRRRFP